LRSDEPDASIVTMNQADLGLNLSTKRTRKREFLEEMQTVVPWADLVVLIAPYAPEGKKGRPPFVVESMLRVHFMRQWFTLSDPAMEDALHDMPLFREFANLSWDARLSDESTILRFGETPSPRHLLERHKLAEQILGTVNDMLQSKGLLLKAGTVVDATLIAAPSSSKNATGERYPAMHQTKRGNQWYFGMKAHISVDADSGLVHTVRGTAANVNDVVEGNRLLHGNETVVFADAGYQGVAKRPDAQADTTWQVAMKPRKRRSLDKSTPLGEISDQIEKLKASVRAKVELPFRAHKRQFGHTKVRYRGLKKNTAQLITLFALSNVWMVRRKLRALDGQVRPKKALAG